MLSASFRRPRSLSRIFGLLLSVLSTSGQIALTVHNHPIEIRRDARASLSQRQEIGGEANCRLCAMSVQSRVVRTSAPAPIAARIVAFAVADAPVTTFGRTPALRASSRAPPAV